MSAQDSLTTQYIDLLKNASTNEEKLQHLDSILANAKSLDDNDYVSYHSQFIDLALSLEKPEAAAQKAIRVSSTLAGRFANLDAAIAILDTVIHVGGQKISDKTQGDLLSRKGQIYMNHGGFDKAIKAYGSALAKYSVDDSLSFADALNYRGRCYANSGQFIKAINDYNLAYDYYEQLGDKQFMLNARQGIIIIYGMNGFYEKAEEERKKYLEGSLAHKFYGNIVLESSNQAFDHQKQGRFKNAEASLLVSEKYLDSMESDYFTGYIYSRMASVYADLEDIEKTEEYLAKFESAPPNFSNGAFRMVNANARSKYQQLLKNYPEAIRLAQERLSLAQNLGYEEQIAFPREQLAELYRLTGNDALALEHFTLAHQLKDSLYNTKSKNALNFYQTLYETEKKEKEIVAKNGAIQLLEKENTYKTRLLSFGGLAAGLLFLIFFINRNRQILKKKKRLQEKYAQDLLHKQEEERKRISKDLHDSIGQSLLLIKNKMALNKDEANAQLIGDALNEVRNISRDLYPFQLKEFGLTRAIESAVENADEATDVFISHEINNIDELFTPIQEVGIYRIIQESLNNIIKHADAKAARVELQKNTDNVSLTIKDNGKGFDFSERYNDFRSLGLKTLKERTKVLNGILKVTSGKGQGAILEFTIPTP